MPASHHSGPDDPGARRARFLELVLGPIMPVLGYGLGQLVGYPVLGLMIGGAAGLASIAVSGLAGQAVDHPRLAAGMAVCVITVAAVLFVVGGLSDRAVIPNKSAPPPSHRKPSPPQSHRLAGSPKVALAVTRWCYCAIEGSSEVEIKVQVNVDNPTSQRVDISAGPKSQIVLALPRRGLPIRWTSAYDPPFRPSPRWLLVPPNPPEQQVKSLSYETHWDGTSLQPGEHFPHTGARADLVFSVPPQLSDPPPAEMSLAYTQPGKRPYVSPGASFPNWPRHTSDPASF